MRETAISHMHQKIETVISRNQKNIYLYISDDFSKGQELNVGIGPK